MRADCSVIAAVADSIVAAGAVVVISSIVLSAYVPRHSAYTCAGITPHYRYGDVYFVCDHGQVQTSRGSRKPQGQGSGDEVPPTARFYKITFHIRDK